MSRWRAACGAADAELLAREIGIKPDEIQKLKPFEAYIGIVGKSYNVLTFPQLDIHPYKTKPAVKLQEYDFLGDGWISC